MGSLMATTIKEKKNRRLMAGFIRILRSESGAKISVSRSLDFVPTYSWLLEIHDGRGVVDVDRLLLEPMKEGIKQLVLR